MADPNELAPWRRTMAPRLAFLAGLFAICVVAVVVRLVHLQVYQHDELTARSRRQRENRIEVAGERGDIVDRHGRVLAYSAELDSVCVNPRKITDPVGFVAKLCAAFGDCTPSMQAVMVERIRSRATRDSIYLRRKAAPDQSARVEALKLDAVHFIKEQHRFYPNRELAAHLLGYVDIDTEGQAGLEWAFNSTLKGTPGLFQLEMDGRKVGKKPFRRVGKPPVRGQSLELTIDVQLQHAAEQVLRDAVREHDALGGCIVMMVPQTGEILALANEPTFNPNNVGASAPEARRNRAVEDIYEPGSVFKIVTASAAFEEHVVGPDDLIDTSPGVIRVGPGRNVAEYDHHNYGVLTFADVIAKSSNVGAIKVGWRTGAPALHRLTRLFGFGSRVSADFPTETRGLVSPLPAWNDGTVASVAMGYGVSVTPLQMLSAANVVANGGALVQPHVVRARHDGRTRTAVPPTVVRRVISAETANAVRALMEGVVARGTARTALAALTRDYAVAGKTGTADKIRGGRYVHDENNTSFVGFVPSEKPALTILAYIDAPRASRAKRSGGAVAAPVFERVADFALRYLGIPPLANPVPPVIVRDGAAAERLPVATPAATLTVVPAAAPIAAGQIVLPDLRGLGGREALRVLTGFGMTPRILGHGVVVGQEPAPGTPVDVGGSCRLVLGRVQGDQP